MSKQPEMDASVFERFNPLPKEVRPALEELLESGELFRYSGDPERSPTTLLEKEFAAYVGMKYAVAVNSCSSGILLSLRLCGVQSGDSVLVPAFTFTAVPSAVVHAGASPILIETTEDFRINVEDFRRKASRAKVLLLSHMRGYMSDLDEIVRICEDHGITLIEDAAHALGSTWNGKQVGSFGKVGVFSFQSNKIINAGEGGMMTTDDEEIAVKAVISSGAYERLYRFHTIDSGLFDQYKKSLPLFNMRLTNVAAAIARPQLATLNERAAAYRLLYATLVAKLKMASNLLAFPQEDDREVRVPDSLQFRIPSFSPEQMQAFIAKTREARLPLSGLGVDKDNARAFWNWNYLPVETDLVETRNMLATTCDMRLPLSLTETHLDFLTETIASAVRLSAIS